eukprot:s3207_g1.t1
MRKCMVHFSPHQVPFTLRNSREFKGKAPPADDPWKSSSVRPPLKSAPARPPPRENMMNKNAWGNDSFQSRLNYDGDDDPWNVPDDGQPLDVNPNAMRGGRPVLRLFGRVQQQSAAAAKAAAQAAEMAAVMAKNQSAGFPKKTRSSSAAEPPPQVSAAAVGSEEAQRNCLSNPKCRSRNQKQGPKWPVSVKRRFEAMEQALDPAYEDDEFSIVSETETSPPCFPNYPAGMPGTFKCGDNWEKEEILLDYNHVDQAIPKPAWVHSSEQWGKTIITMPKYAKQKITFHQFTLMVFGRDEETSRYAKKLIGKFRRHVTACPRTQAPDLTAWLLHTRVDSFIDAGKTYRRQYAD